MCPLVRHSKEQTRGGGGGAEVVGAGGREGVGGDVTGPKQGAGPGNDDNMKALVEVRRGSHALVSRDSSSAIAKVAEPEALFLPPRTHLHLPHPNASSPPLSPQPLLIHDSSAPAPVSTSKSSSAIHRQGGISSCVMLYITAEGGFNSTCRLPVNSPPFPLIAHHSAVSLSCLHFPPGSEASCSKKPPQKNKNL